MDASFPQRRWRWLALALFATYLALACGGLQLVDGADGAATIWPAAGLAVGALVLSPRRAWPWFAVAIFAANLSAQLVVRGATVPLGLGISAGGLGQSLIAALVIAAMVGRERPRIGSLRTVAGLFAGAAIGGGLAAAAGAIELHAASGASFPTALIGWWLGNAVGMLVMTPVMLALSEPEDDDGRGREAIFLVTLTAAAALALFWRRPDTGLAVLSFGLPLVPLLLWCAIRAGARAATFASALVAAIAATTTVRGLGPFALATFDEHERAQVLQGYLAIIVLSTLLVGAVVADQRRSQALARRAEADLRTVFDQAPIGHAILDARGSLVESNAALTAITGFDLDALRASGEGLVDPGDLAPLRELFAAIRCGDLSSGELEVRAIHRDGHPLDLALHVAVLGGGDGRGRTLIQVIDISDRKQLEAQLRRLADHDPLTGLLNRRRFDQEVAAHLARTRRYGPEGAVLMLDLDGFKGINDTLGHQVGDELLTRVATRLGRRLRTSDILARLGGDEFAILLPQADREGAAHVAHSLVCAVREELDVTISVGVTMVDDSGPISATHLLRAADRAMYAAKAEGRDRYAFSAPA